MVTKHFDAILAKNNIAREIKTEDIVNTEYIRSQLKIIEAWIGEANQPSVDDIINTEKFDL